MALNQETRVCHSEDLDNQGVARFFFFFSVGETGKEPPGTQTEVNFFTPYEEVTKRLVTHTDSMPQRLLRVRLPRKSLIKVRGS